MSTRYKVTLVNGDEFYEDSFSAAAGRYSRMMFADLIREVNEGEGGDGE